MRFRSRFALLLALVLRAHESGAVSDPGFTFHDPPKPLSPEAVTDDWPGFRGRGRNGVCRETRLLKNFSNGNPTLLWEMNKGTGYSAPAIVGDRLVFFHRLDDRETVVCLNAATGETLWRFDYPSTYRDRYGYSNGPRSTPMIDGQRVYTIGAEGKLHSLDLESGQPIWKQNLKTQFDLEQDFFGVASSPLIEESLLVVHVGAPGGPCTVAFDKRNGQVVWEAGTQWGPSYASPVAATIHDQRRILVFAGGESRPPTGGLLCINAADGQIDFRFPWRSRSYESVNAASPVVVGNDVFISASYRTGGALIRIHLDFTHHVLWTTQHLGTHFGTAVHEDGFLYGFDGRNEPDAALVCVDMKTGKEAWRFAPEWTEQYVAYGQPRETTYGMYRGSLLKVDDRFLCLGERGHLLWLDLSPNSHHILARTWLFAAPQTWTPPAVSRGLLYVVQNERDPVNHTPPRLLCYDLRGQ